MLVLKLLQALGQVVGILLFILDACFCGRIAHVRIIELLLAKVLYFLIGALKMMILNLCVGKKGLLFESELHFSVTPGGYLALMARA